MASYRTPIKIQKLDYETEVWSDYYSTHANINKSGGKEYFNASSNISNSTFNFKVRYCESLKDIQYETEIYRVMYDKRYFNIKNVDNFNMENHELTLVGEFNGKVSGN